MTPRQILIAVLAGLLAWGGFDNSRCLGQDTVYVASGETGVIGYSGEVISYTGDKLVLKLASGNEREFPNTDKIVRIDTRYNTEYRQALAEYESGEFENALEGFERAFENENRAWVQRMILEQIIYCEQNLGRWESAGRRFLLLVSSDPKTPYFPAIPLAWVPDPLGGTLEQQAKTWMGAAQPVSKLLGASHLLVANRAEAERVLSDLRFNADQRVAALARMQLWRTDLHRSDLDRIASWEKELQRFPHSLKAGGYFLIGSANAQVKRAEEAALNLMRVPIHFPSQRRLAARCLIESGRQLEALGQTAEATRLYTELVDEFSAFPESAEAKDRLETLAIGQNDAPKTKTEVAITK